MAGVPETPAATDSGILGWDGFTGRDVALMFVQCQRVPEPSVFGTGTNGTNAAQNVGQTPGQTN